MAKISDRHSLPNPNGYRTGVIFVNCRQLFFNFQATARQYLMLCHSLELHKHSFLAVLKQRETLQCTVPCRLTDPPQAAFLLSAESYLI